MPRPSKPPAPKRRSAARTAPGAEAMLRRLGARCRELREAAGLTQQKAAEHADLAISHVQVVESGRANPTATTLSALARAYGVTLSALFDGI